MRVRARCVTLGSLFFWLAIQTALFFSRAANVVVRRYRVLVARCMLCSSHDAALCVRRLLLDTVLLNKPLLLTEGCSKRFFFLKKKYRSTVAYLVQHARARSFRLRRLCGPHAQKEDDHQKPRRLENRPDLHDREGNDALSTQRERVDLERCVSRKHDVVFCFVRPFDNH